MTFELSPLASMIPITAVLLVLAVPCLWMMAMLAAVISRRQPRSDGAWRLAEGVALAVLAIAAVLGAGVVAFGPRTYEAATAWMPAVRLDALSALLLAMVGFLGWVIVRYSARYLDGDDGRMRYLAWLAATLAAVWCLLAFDNLLLVCLAWSLSSLCLHPLLTFYGNRPAAMLAAHKKFLVSRLADVLTLAGCGAIYFAMGTLRIDEITTRLAAGALPAEIWVPAAGVAFALAAILKCAQLPFHGWLLQVMEAPTPVSALLHAGIVNIGGFVLLRLAGLLEHAPLAQALLVVAGSVTAGVAALVMMTRISVKVMLAWSTVAQMGFMLLEIGLGAYALALLHLLAHSMYKAHAFLAAGASARHQFALRIAPARHQVTPAAALLGLAAIGLGIALAVNTFAVEWRDQPATWLLTGALAAGLWPLVRARTINGDLAHTLMLVAYAFGLSLVYFAWHQLFDHLAPVASVIHGAFGALFAAACLVTLLVVQEIVLAQPDGWLARWLHPRAFAGFHLDESFTRLTWAIWPAPANRRATRDDLN